MQEDVGCGDREGQNHASGNLVERSVDVFECVVAETIADVRYL